MSDHHDAARTERSTIEDVAAAAQVSVATVSRALRGLPNVAASTRRRVEDVARELAYRPDPAASRLATGRAHSVAVVVPLVNSWYCSEVVAGVEAVCAEAGYDTVVISLGTDGGGRRHLDGTEALDRRVDGLVLVDLAIGDDEIEALRFRGLKLVSIGPHLDGWPSTGIDDVAVGEIVADYVISLGHRRLGVIDDSADQVFDFVVPSQRQLGFERGCARHGIEIDPRCVVEGSFTIQGGYEAMEQLMALPDRPSALFALGDEMAFGALQYAREAGIDIPGDVSIIGVDDQPAAAVLGLTTVHQDVDKHGARAARWLIDQLAGVEVEPIRTNASVQLIERTTCAPPPA
jgi:DNA-binding LacI/PurR family transcriptional regulator